MAVHHLSSKPLQKTLPKWICPAFPSKSDLGKHSLFKNFLDLNQVFIPRTILLCLVCNQIILWKIIKSDTKLFISLIANKPSGNLVLNKMKKTSPSRYLLQRPPWKTPSRDVPRNPLQKPPLDTSSKDPLQRCPEKPLQKPPPETSSKDLQRRPERPPPDTPSTDPLQKPPPETPSRELHQTHLAFDKAYWKF